MEEARKRFRSELDSNSQERLSLKKEIKDLRTTNAELRTAQSHSDAEKIAWEKERADLKNSLAASQKEKEVLSDQLVQAEG